jgi:hypothetical protein
VTTVALTVGAVSVAGLASDAVYTVLVPLPVLDTQKGLPAETEIPHVPTRLGSTTAAPASAESAIRSVRTKFVAAKADTDNSAAATIPKTQFFEVLIFTSPEIWFAMTRISQHETLQELILLEPGIKRVYFESGEDSSFLRIFKYLHFK